MQAGTSGLSRKRSQVKAVEKKNEALECEGLGLAKKWRTPEHEKKTVKGLKRKSVRYGRRGAEEKK